jgi:hypothetical protein
LPIYEIQCIDCGKVSEHFSFAPSTEDFPCPKCLGPTKRLYSLCHMKMFQSFCTRNILPDGTPITITSQKQLSSLCNEFGLNHLDDPKAEVKHAKPKTVEEILGTRIQPETREEASGPIDSKDILP